MDVDCHGVGQAHAPGVDVEISLVKPEFVGEHCKTVVGLVHDSAHWYALTFRYLCSGGVSWPWPELSMQGSRPADW